MSPATALQLAPVLDTDRNHLVYALGSTAVEPFALEDEDEIAVAGLAEWAILDILKIADSLAALSEELGARRRRRDRHAFGCPTCLARKRCRAYQNLLNEIDALQRRCADQAARLRRPR